MKQININENEQKINIDIIANINIQLNKLIDFKNQLIDENNIEKIKVELTKASSLIEDVHAMENNVNNNKFNRLQFIYNSLILSVQKYELEQEMYILNSISKNINKEVIIIDEKLKEIQEKQKELKNQTEKAEERNNNLVYNLLGFLTAFSIVSGVIGVVSDIDNVVKIMLFMTFTILLLLTTLIGLHNFYENNNKRETKLQDNYFLWKVVGIIFIFLIVVLGIQGISNNKDKIFNYIDNKIEQVIEEKVTEKLK